MMTGLKMATVLGVAGAIAFSVPQAEARNGRNAAIGAGIAVGALALGAAAAAASQPRYYYNNGYYNNGYGGPYAYETAPYAYEQPYVVSPYGYNSYNSYDVGPSPWQGNHRNSTRVPGTNWNRNQ